MNIKPTNRSSRRKERVVSEAGVPRTFVESLIATFVELVVIISPVTGSRRRNTYRVVFDPAHSPRLRVSASPCLFLLLSLILATNTPAQTNFTSGSDGSLGATNITTDTTLDMPTNGIFNFTTITVASGGILRFNRNPLNTPVYLLATGDVIINGRIDVSGGSPSGRVPGQGGPGGFDGGWGGYGGTGTGGTGVGSDGEGPGGGRGSISCGGGGAFGTAGYNNVNVYGNSLLSPLIGGSGGAGGNGNPGYGGGGGGGAILIASSTRIVANGYVDSYGGYGFGGGSGGGVRLVAPVVTGSGSLRVFGSGQVTCGYPGLGRIRIDCLDGYAVRSLTANATVFSRGAQMFVFPTNPLPRLDIIQAAGQVIPLGSPTGVSIALPKGATNAQTVIVKATNFTNDVPITVAIIPNDQPSYTYQALISLTNNPATVTVPVTLSVDSTNRIMVWTTPL